MLSTHLTDYRLLGLVGQGQFAQVYCAVHRRTGQVVAIKQTRHSREQVSQEADILTALDHSNIVKCYASKQTDRHCQLILQYCESGTLRNHLDNFNSLPFAQAKSFLIEILSALSCLHEKEIIHDDLKPENILLTHGSKGLTTKLSDFGNAHAATVRKHPSREIGSPTYAAPERFEGQASYATDLYSVGVMLYEMLLGDRPFSGTPQELYRAHKEKPICLSASSLTRPVIELIKRALHKDPAQRFASASAMLRAAEQLCVPFSQTESAKSLQISPVVARLSKLAIKPIDIPNPVEHLISTSRGCCIKTSDALYLLDKALRRSLIAPIQSATQISVDPSYRWFVTFTKQRSIKRAAQHSVKIHYLESVRPFQTVALKDTEADRERTETIQILAISRRYLLRIRTSSENPKTFLECFTRNGQFVGQYTVNFILSAVALASLPYQLIACSGAQVFYPTAAVISLSPFQIRYLPCPTKPLCATATTWGYVVVCHHAILFFDRNNNLLGQLENHCKITAIAPLTSHQLLLSTPHSNKSYLHLLELDKLPLDIIF